MTASPSNVAPDHLRVLDMANHLGQMCAQALGDLGADVVKVEPPTGDPTRRMPPFAGDIPGPERNLRFINANRSKRSVVLDAYSPGDREKLLEMAKRSDTMVENFAPGHLATLGLGHEDVRRANPGIVYVSFTPFGQNGPHAHHKGGDLVAQATAGIMMANGGDETRPCMAPYDITTQVAGPFATRYLATFEAEVVKVEEADMSSNPDPQELNRCKLSCIIDARKSRGKELIEDMDEVLRELADTPALLCVAS